MSNVDANNRGKDFEIVIRKAFESVPQTVVERLPDPTMGYLGVRNKSDFLIYSFPFQYYIECKTVHSHRFPLSNITFNQRVGMLEVSKTMGVVAGIICWFIPEDRTIFMPIQTIEKYRLQGEKSINLRKIWDEDFIEIQGKKKRVFFEYDMTQFLQTCEVKKLGVKTYDL